MCVCWVFYSLSSFNREYVLPFFFETDITLEKSPFWWTCSSDLATICPDVVFLMHLFESLRLEHSNSFSTVCSLLLDIAIRLNQSKSGVSSQIHDGGRRLLSVAANESPSPGIPLECVPVQCLSQSLKWNFQPFCRGVAGIHAAQIHHFPFHILWFFHDRTTLRYFWYYAILIDSRLK